MKHRLLFPAVVVCLAAFFAIPAMAQFSGAIDTTTVSGGLVNVNLFTDKSQVYINGGPQNPNPAGLPPGTYYFQVTDPSGKVLLSDDPAACRQLTVDSTGRVVGYYDSGCHHANGDTNPANGNTPVQLGDPTNWFNDTPNNGGVYKAWLISQDPTIGCATTVDQDGLHLIIPNGCTKTDNFRIRCSTDCGVVPPQVFVSGLKYYDSNGDGVFQLATDPPLANWEIDVAVTPASGSPYNSTLTTDSNGNWAIGLNTGDTFQACEVVPAGWTQSAPTDTTGATGVSNASIIPVNGVKCWNATVSTTDADGFNFGNYQQISGVKYLDLNANGKNDGNETLLNGFTVNVCFPTQSQLCPAATKQALTTATDPATKQDGVWKAILPAPLDTTLVAYNACESVPAGWVQTGPLQFSDPGNSVPTASTTGNGTVDTSKCWNGSGNATGLDFGNYAQLTVKKDAAATFTRTYTWSVSKSVDKTLVEQIGGTATFNYTVTATLTGSSDSLWKVSGTITVNNPNPVSVTATVTDSIDNNGTCAVTGGAAATLAPGDNLFAYTCSYITAPSPTSGTNTATATWANGAPTGTAGYAFGAPTSTVNQTITVTDTFNGGSAVTLGTVNAGTNTTTVNASAGFTITSPSFGVFKYARTINVPASNCLSYPNTATVVLTTNPPANPTANASVEVCGAAKTGALTMGFWQNKNGQAIITGQAKTGVCPSYTWLLHYTPFQDLPLNSTCSQVATYVYNAIKAASAGGSTMNPMLKAQDLATSLDVYFSGGNNFGSGGNPIGAPGPIGAVTIDLTKICKMIDSSGGTATCSGTFENVSSAFGGATSMTVSNMLLFQNTVSTSGGVSWYGQNKTTQGLAKDAFDAINNGVAFAP